MQVWTELRLAVARQNEQKLHRIYVALINNFFAKYLASIPSLASFIYKDNAMDSLIKHREIVFAGPHPDMSQARLAMLLLTAIPSISNMNLLSSNRLLVSYRVDEITLEDIHDVLQLVGFHLDNSLLIKLKNALCYYCEETQRANMGLKSCKAMGHLFVNRYRNLQHGCRDERPEHWRQYF